MDSPSGIVEALYYILCKMFLSSFIKMTRIIHTFYLCKNQKFHTWCTICSAAKTDVSLTVVLKIFMQWFLVYIIRNFTYPQRGKQPSRPKPQTSWCAQMFSAVSLIGKGFVVFFICRLERQREAPFRVLQLGARAASVLSARWDTESELVSS